MTLANLIGLLGLLSIIVLIIIYIIKPNYQQKFISSTYVWKLSLKYRKRKINTNKLMNLLLILCQVLVLTACALILARPIVEAADTRIANEKIIVIDASANMRAEYDEETRFERAISAVKTMMAEAFEKDEGRVSIIIAGETAKYLDYTVELRDENGNIVEQQTDIRRVSSTSLEQINKRLDSILNSVRVNGVLNTKVLDEYCTYGSGDIDGALSLAESILNENSDCKVDLYTGTQYETDVTSIVDVHYEEVRAVGERNVAILGGSANLNSHYSYNFSVDVAVYGQNATARVRFYFRHPNISISNPDGKEFEDFDDYIDVNLDNGVPKTVVYDTWSVWNSGDDDKSYDQAHTIFSYEYVQVTVEVLDSQFKDALAIDNYYYFYDGKKPTLKLQYKSALPNPFMNSIIGSWRSSVASTWEVAAWEVPVSGYYDTEGYDIYIFEHEMPTEMPDDGVVILLDPATQLPKESGLVLREVYDPRPREGEDLWNDYAEAFRSVESVTHPILEHIVPEDIKVTKKTLLSEITGYEHKYDVLMTMTGTEDNPGTFPALYFLNEPAAKRVVFCVDVNRSNLVRMWEFPLMMWDIFNLFFPEIISEYSYEIGDRATFNSISSEVYCEYPDGTEKVYSNPTTTIKLDAVGSYRLMQRKINSEEIYTYFFVKAPAVESDILRVEYNLANPYIENRNVADDLDLLIYFAAALVALLFAEWWLQSRNQF